MQPLLVSVIVPVLNDDAALADLLATFRGDADCDLTIAAVGTRLPPVTSAGGSTVRWVSTATGRGRQMNDGARRSEGKWLLFLHADTRLPDAWLDEIRRIDAARDVIAGCFSFQLDSTEWWARLVERGVRLRVRWLHLPYGDQALFVRRAAFDDVRGYREWPIMEDVDLVRRLRMVGRLAALDLPATTSARRWERDGWFRRSATNLLLLFLYVAGASPTSLARWYYRLMSRG